jgi:hypothetical protein
VYVGSVTGDLLRKDNDIFGNAFSAVEIKIE